MKRGPTQTDGEKAMDPKLLNDMIADWQQIVDLIAKIAQVPAGLIMELSGENISVLVSSDTKGNPYHAGETCPWVGSGLYCEQVITSQDMMLVPNALQSPKWRQNPDIKLGMVSYLGFPLRLPNGSPFGTLCLLDAQENHFSSNIIALMEKMQALIEENLKIRALLQQNDQRTAEIAQKNAALKKLNRSLSESEKKLRFITENTVDSIWVYNVDQDQFTRTNDGEPQLREGKHKILQKWPLCDVVAPEFLEVTRQRIQQNARILRDDPSANVVSRHQLQSRRADGSMIWIEYNTRYMINAEGQIEVVGVSRNIEDRKRKEQEISFLSTHDYLTKTFNRSCLFTQGATEIDEGARHGKPISMIFFDLDSFKHINDQHGHATGDVVLQRTTQAVAGLLKKTDLFIRYGGEEFVVLLPNTDLATAYELAQNMREIVENTAMPNGITTTISIGVAERRPNEDLYHWIDRTDKTMYKAKKAGRNRVIASGLDTADV